MRNLVTNYLARLKKQQSSYIKCTK